MQAISLDAKSKLTDTVRAPPDILTQCRNKGNSARRTSLATATISNRLIARLMLIYAFRNVKIVTVHTTC